MRANWIAISGRKATAPNSGRPPAWKGLRDTGAYRWGPEGGWPVGEGQGRAMVWRNACSEVGRVRPHLGAFLGRRGGRRLPRLAEPQRRCGGRPAQDGGRGARAPDVRSLAGADP